MTSDSVGTPSRWHIGLIGCGAVGLQVIEVLAADPALRLTLLQRSAVPKAAVPLPVGIDIVNSLSALLASEPELVLEMSSVQAFREIVPLVLEAGIDVIAASVGALEDPGFLRELTRIADGSGARLILPSGAVGGLDYLIATRSLEDVSIVYTSRKPPSAWQAELVALGEPMQPAVAVILFEGSAAEAARRYPRNLNAGLTIALAGGLDRTRVRVLADPDVDFNTHEIEVRSSAGVARMRFENRPSVSNPKTSALTGLSLAAMVHRCLDSVSI